VLAVTRSLGDADDTPGARPGVRDEPVNGVDQDAFGAWYRWRRSRPFWGGLLVLLAGAEILLSERAPLPVVIHVGMQGLAGYLVPLIMLLCGLMLWFNPVQRTFYSILAMLLALGSWITSNLGGFFIGMALGVVGGALAFAWVRGSGRKAQLDLWPPPRESTEGLDLILAEPDTDSESPVADVGGANAPADDPEPIPEEPALGKTTPADEPASTRMDGTPLDLSRIDKPRPGKIRPAGTQSDRTQADGTQSEFALSRGRGVAGPVRLAQSWLS
jgi:hypothetical protein